MKQIFILALVVSLLPACNKSDFDNTASLDGKWKMIKLVDTYSDSVTTKPSSTYRDDEVIFSHSNTSDGFFSGNIPTNTIMQTTFTTGANQSLTISDFFISLVAETFWGEEFLNHIRNTQSYSFDSGNLVIHTNDGYLLVFSKE